MSVALKGREKLAQAMSERELLRSVLDEMELRGWLVAHFHDSRRDVGRGQLVGDSASAGFPDIVAVRGERILFAELKTEKGKLGELQAAWLGALEKAALGAYWHVDVYVWRPIHLLNGALSRVLR
jgi:hypothetical protein